MKERENAMAAVFGRARRFLTTKPGEGSSSSSRVMMAEPVDAPVDVGSEDVDLDDNRVYSPTEGLHAYTH
jgi:hypothetical protein